VRSSFFLDNFGGVVLDDDHGELFVRGNHDFVLARSDSNEDDLFVCVEAFDRGLSFGGELGDERACVDGLLLVHG